MLKAEIAAHEVGSMLTHLGVWTLRVQALPDGPETPRDAAKRILRHLHHLENDDDSWHIELRTDRMSIHPLQKRPPQEG